MYFTVTLSKFLVGTYVYFTVTLCNFLVETYCNLHYSALYICHNESSHSFTTDTAIIEMFLFSCQITSSSAVTPANRLTRIHVDVHCTVHVYHYSIGIGGMREPTLGLERAHEEPLLGWMAKGRHLG